MKDLNIPKLGPVNKHVVIAVGIGAVGFVGWRYYVSRSAASSVGTADATTSDFADGGTVPSVLNAVPSDGSFGGDTGATGTTTTTTNTPGNFANNAEWTQYVTGQLESSDTWSYSDIVTALGNAFASKPLSTLQQSIVQAALAVGGPPPVGTLVLVTGGNTPVTGTPSGFVILAEGPNSTTVRFSAVPGADHYLVYKGGSVVASGASSPITITGLTPSTKSTYTMAAVSASGAAGPMSGPFIATTSALPKPAVAPPVKK